MIGQWPQIDRILVSIEDDPSLKVSSLIEDGTLRKTIFFLVYLGWKLI